jgi:hypothetical protein
LPTVEDRPDLVSITLVATFGYLSTGLEEVDMLNAVEKWFESAEGMLFDHVDGLQPS